MNRKPIRKARTFFQKRNAKKRFRRCATLVLLIDEIFMFKRLVLQELYGLSD